jgi:MFS family permease
MFVYRIKIVEKDVLVSGKKYSSISAIQGAGGLIGALVAGQLQGFFKIPWRQIFLFLAIFLFTMVILLLIKLRKFPEIHFISTHNEPWRNILKIPLNRIILIITGTTLFCFAMLNSWIQKYFQEFHGLSQQGSVLFMAIFAFGQFLGFILGGFIVDHLYKTKHTIFRYFGLILVIITSSCMTIGFLIPWNIQLGQDSQDYLHLALETIKLALSDSRVFWTIVLVFIGNLINAFAPYLYLIIRVKNEEEVGYRIISIIFLINTLSQFICPVLGGLFGDLFGLRILMVACPIVILLTFFGYIKLNKEIDKCSNAEID